MTTFDLKPLFHSTIGFDKLLDLFEHSSLQTSPKPGGYPPYNIAKVGEDSYEIVMAVAGFTKDQITLTLHDNHLKVEAINAPSQDQTNQKEYLHKGIAMRSFEKSFQLADFILVKNVQLKNGLLTISLQREIPEERKTRTIDIEDLDQSVPSEPKKTVENHQKKGD